MMADQNDESNQSDRQFVFQLPVIEVLEMLNGTNQPDARPILFRVKPDRRMRNEPRHGPDRRRRG
jgi:hypothetical protein